jgi:hypothetical protein
LIHAAVIYKWTDADGVVHFSDQPVAGAQRIVTGGAPSPNRAVAPAAPVAPPATPKPAKPVGYSEFSIESPTSEATYFAGAVSVRAHLAPGLKPNHVVTWTLNGQPLEEPLDALEFHLDDLSRGTYNLNASVSDTDTREVLAATEVTFFVRQPSMLSPAHK